MLAKIGEFEMIKIPRCMSTQHPDNVRPPFFSDSTVLQGEDEIKEAFYTFSHLKCPEQLWDFEGKEVDSHVIKKLLTRYERFFTKNRLGKNLFLTLRVPNPEIEKNEAKILLETLESIPRAYDAARTFYSAVGQDDDIAPIFEVAVPMVEDYKTVSRVAQYYHKFVTSKASKSILHNDITVEKWIGDFKPEKIRTIPLMETVEAMLKADKITESYINEEKIKDWQRVWLARSDPALNYGNLSAVLIEKIALQRLHELEQKTSVDIHPILGCGSAPFRGNFKPTNIDITMRDYPSVQTFTLQSAFKYDYDERIVREAIDTINTTTRSKPTHIDEPEAKKIIEKTSKEYSKAIKILAPMISQMAQYVPQRRMRKLHIGLFGYARESKGITLPRAIKFCSALYSYGLPPELLGLNALNEKEIDMVKDYYSGFEADMKDSLKYLNRENLNHFPNEIRHSVHETLEKLNMEFKEDHAHSKVTSIILKDLKDNNTTAITENIERAGWLRGFLG